MSIFRNQHDDYLSPIITNKKRLITSIKQYFPFSCFDHNVDLSLCTFPIADPASESRTLINYVPRDEAFSEIKQLQFSAKTLYSVLHGLVPSLETAIIDTDLGFPYFTAIDKLFNEGVNVPMPETFKEKALWRTILPRLVKGIEDTGKEVLRFETPETMDSKD